MIRIYILCIFLIVLLKYTNAQQDNFYKLPSEEILELADYQSPPRAFPSKDGKRIVYLYNETYLALQDISQEKVRLANVTFDPIRYIRSPIVYIDNIRFQNINESSIESINGLPADPKIANLKWSPDEEKIAFTNTTNEGVELWIIDLETRNAEKISEPIINACLQNPYVWFADSNSL